MRQNITDIADGLESLLFLIHGRDPLEGHGSLLGSGNIRYLGNNKGLILFAKLCKLWLTHAKSLQENRLLKQKQWKETKISNHIIKYF